MRAKRTTCKGGPGALHALGRWPYPVRPARDRREETRAARRAWACDVLIDHALAEGRPAPRVTPATLTRAEYLRARRLAGDDGPGSRRAE